MVSPGIALYALVLTQGNTVKPSVLTIDEGKVFFCQHFAAEQPDHLAANTIH